MRIIDDMIMEYRYKKYKDKFTRFNVAPIMATVFHSDDGINIIKMVNSSRNYEYFKDSIIVDLLGPRENDFQIFNLLMGLYFDVFNLYGYMYIDPDVRRDIAVNDINKDKTLDFLNSHEEELFLYFEEEYGIDKETFSKIKKELFSLNDYDSYLYNSPIIYDIGKILMGYTLSGKFLGCRELIEFFDTKNAIKYKKTI